MKVKVTRKTRAGTALLNSGVRKAGATALGAALALSMLVAGASAAEEGTETSPAESAGWVGNSPNQTDGTDYYLDFEQGDDSNPGTSQDKAWKNLTKANETTFAPGDRILLKAGSTWHGQQLWPKGSGEDEQPIVIAAYGDSEERPYISTDGNVVSPFLRNATSRTPVKNPETVGTSGAIVLRNQHHYEIHDLEVSNDNDFDEDIDAREDTCYDGISISINADKFAEDDLTIMRYFRLSNLYIHDTDGPNDWQSIYRAGINFQVFGSKSYGQYDESGYYFEDVRIENNTIKNVELNGIQFGFIWWGDNPGQYDETGKFHEGWEQLWVRTRDLYSRNVYIGHNYLESIGQGGVQLGNTKDMVVEYNEINEFLARYHAVSAGLYLWAGADAVMQYNEVYGGPYNEFDGTPWDLEYTNFNVTYQYNYSHDNPAGWMSYMGNSDNSIARYNLSIDDNGVLVKNMLSTNYEPTYFTNNVFIYDASKMDYFHDEVFKSTVYFMNNIFYNKSETTPTPWYRRTGALNNAVFSNNDFYEAGGVHSEREPADPRGLSVDPKFVSDPLQPAPTIGVENIVDVAKQYSLSAGSPLIDAGRYNVHIGEKDFVGNGTFWGNAPDIGLAEFKQGAEVTDPVDDDPIEAGPVLPTNYALNKPVVAASTHPNADRQNLHARNLVDGRADTRWAAADEPEYPLTIDIDLEQMIEINEVVLSEFIDGNTPPRVGTYSFYAWDSKTEDWVATPFVNKDDGIGAERKVNDFDPVTTSKLRFAIDAKLPNRPWGPTMTEIRVHGRPVPAESKPSALHAAGLYDQNPVMKDNANNKVAFPITLNGDVLQTIRYVGTEGNVLGSLIESEDYVAISGEKCAADICFALTDSFLNERNTGDSGLRFEFESDATVDVDLYIVDSSPLADLIDSVEAIQGSDSPEFTALQSALKTAKDELAKANRDIPGTGNDNTNQEKLDAQLKALAEAKTAFEQTQPGAPKVKITTTSRCVAGKVVLAVTAENEGEGDVTVSTKTSFGTASFGSLAAGSKASKAISTRQTAIAASTAETTVTGVTSHVLESSIVEAACK